MFGVGVHLDAGLAEPETAAGDHVKCRIRGDENKGGAIEDGHRDGLLHGTLRYARSFTSLAG